MMEAHPLAELFPAIEGPDFEVFADDIAANGLREAITTLDGKILDGRNRYRACGLRGVLARFVEYEGDDPAAFVISANLRRRHLTNTERAMLAARLADYPNGHVSDSERLTVRTEREAAEALKVSVRSVGRAKAVINKGVPELADAVKTGAIALRPAADLAMKPAAEQRAALSTSKPAKPKAPSPAPLSLGQEISAFIRELPARGVGKLPMAQRIALAEAFTAALNVKAAAIAPAGIPRDPGNTSAPVAPSKAASADDPVAAFLAAGGSVIRCPPTIGGTQKDRAALEAHHARQDRERAEKAGRNWGYSPA
jgi:hypothetical protein